MKVPVPEGPTQILKRHGFRIDVRDVRPTLIRDSGPVTGGTDPTLMNAIETWKFETWEEAHDFAMAIIAKEEVE